MREKSHKTSVKRENRRYDHKTDRQATRAALRGDHVKQPQTDRYNHRPDPVTLPDDATVVGPCGKTKGKGKICKRNKNGPHIAEYRVHKDWWRDGYFCKKCNKNLWGYKPTYAESLANHSPEHWMTTNILIRLRGGECPCSACVDKRKDS